MSVTKEELDGITKKVNEFIGEFEDGLNRNWREWVDTWYGSGSDVSEALPLYEKKFDFIYDNPNLYQFELNPKSMREHMTLVKNLNDRRNAFVKFLLLHEEILDRQWVLDMDSRLLQYYKMCARATVDGDLASEGFKRENPFYKGYVKLMCIHNFFGMVKKIVFEHAVDLPIDELIVSVSDF